jgi:heptosyltransferase-2
VPSFPTEPGLPVVGSIGRELVSSILVLRGGAIGDFILTLPAIRSLRERFPEARLEIIGYEQIAKLARLAGYADAIRSIEFGPLASFFARDGDLPAELVEYFANFQQVVSYLSDPEEIFATNLRRAGVKNLIVCSPKITGREHAARQLARPLQSLGIRLEDPTVWILPDQPSFVKTNRVALHPGSGSNRKNWPLDRWLELARSLLDQDRKRMLLLVGGEADGERLAALRASLPDQRIEVAESLPLTALAAELHQCAALVGHDSGISHLAAAVGAPSVLLYGPTDPAVWAPQNPQVRVIQAAAGIMETITTEEVVSAVNEALRHSRE